jgi:hypothetical protein
VPTELQGARESNRINAPVTLGVVRPAIVLPVDWRGWDRATLEAVLAHERSHLQRRDPAVQLLSALHRALLWASPLSWFLHAKLVQTAEEVSDDAATAVCGGAAYAEILLDFMKRKTRGPIWAGLSMASHANPEKRLLRIIDQPVLSNGITKRAAAAIIGVTLPVTYLAAAAKAEFVPRLDEARGFPAPEAPPPSAVPSVRAGRIEPKKTISASGPVFAQVAAQAHLPIEGESPATEVRLTVSVTDPAGRYVAGLKAQDFQTTTGQISQEITSVESTMAQHSVVLLNTIAAGDGVAKALRDVLDPSDQLAELAGPPASDPAMFWDAVASAVNQVKGMTNPYKSVVVVMQGGGDYPISREADLARILRRAWHSPRVIVSFANIEDITEPYNGSLSQQDDLRIVAGATGGQVVPAPSAAEVATSVMRIGLALAHQYVIGFNPGSAPQGALHRPAAVSVTDHGYPPFRVIGPGYYLEP